MAAEIVLASDEMRLLLELVIHEINQNDNTKRALLLELIEDKLKEALDEIPMEKLKQDLQGYLDSWTPSWDEQ